MRAPTAKEIQLLIANKHDGDVVVTECKNGPTQGYRNQRTVDCWVMKSSWAHPSLIGYEIKVTRADFLRDTKWQSYLPMCNELYFVCPWKMLAPEEMPEGVGLMWASRNLSRLYTKRKASWRKIDEPGGVYRYVLMFRARIEAPAHRGDDARDRWREWLKSKREGKTLGYEVAKKIREEHSRLYRAARDAEARVQGYEWLLDELCRLGVSRDKLRNGYFDGAVLEVLRGKQHLPDRSVRVLRETGRRLIEMADEHSPGDSTSGCAESG